MSRQYLEGADVKTLDEGKYYIASPVNAPTPMTCFVDVKSNPAGARKIIEVIPVNQSTTYIIRLMDGVWSDWESVTKNTDLDVKNYLMTRGDIEGKIAFAADATGICVWIGNKNYGYITFK